MHLSRIRTTATRRRLTSAALVLATCGALAAPSAQAAAAAPATTATKTAGLAKTPPMGFNDWNAFGCNVSEQLIEQTADYFVSSGLKAAGYTYVNIDDCWLEKSRSADGHLVPDPVKFPDGIKGTADYVHSKGLKLGIYEDAGTQTCAGYPGSLGHEQTDADDFAAWGVDYLKYDNCNNNSDGSLAEFTARYTAMGNALHKTGRKIVYSICEWGQNDPWQWAGDVGNLWRTTGDISDNWNSLKSIIAANSQLAQYAKPGAWNDPDMLEVGNGGMTDTEYRTHFSLWAEMAAPLLIGTDLRKASAETLAIYKNTDVIAVDQDSLGVQAQVIAAQNGTMVFSKPLANGDRSIALYNSTDAPARISTTTAQAGLRKSPAYRLTDLWTKARTETAGTIAATVPAHGTVMVRVHAVTTWQQLAPATSLDVAATSGFNGSDVSVDAGSSATLTAAVHDYGRAKITGVRITADAPDDWTLTPRTKWTAKSIKRNGALQTTWTVTAPADVQAGSHPLTFTATYSYGKHVVQATYRAHALVLPVPPSGTVDLSSIDWTAATNGWGPVEKDMSNGETAAGDGTQISIRGTKYPKGLGTNAVSDVTYYLGGRCTSLTSAVGIDDEEATKGGNVIFQVFADSTKVADSGALTNTSPVHTVTADLTGATWLRLHVDPNGDTSDDHGDWAGPRLTCN